MKIGVTAFPLSKGKETGRGLDRTFYEIVKGFSKRKVSFSYYDLGFIPKEWQAIFRSLSFINFLRKTKDDIYLAVYPVAAIFPILVNKRPLISGIHDMIPFHVFGYNNRVKYAFKRFCIRFCAQKSDHIIVGLNTTKKEIINFFKIPAQKISVVPYGVDFSTYFLDNKIKKIPNRIAFLGEAKRAKGMDTVIKAFSLVNKKIPNSKLFLASHGVELPQMKELAKRSLAKNSYEFLGFIPENKMREFYAKTEVFVFPSRHGYGLSALESMACGTPAVVGDTLDSRDFFTDPDLLVDPEDYKELANKISRLLLDRELYQKKRKEALEKVKDYSWDKTSEGYLKVINNFYLESRKEKAKNINNKSLNRVLLNLLKIIISFGLLFYLFSTINLSDTFSLIRESKISYIILATFLNISALFIAIYRWHLLTSKNNPSIKIRFWQSFSMYLTSSFFNSFLPSTIGGDTIRTIKLNSLTKDASSSISSVLIDRLLGFWSGIFLALILALVNFSEVRNLLPSIYIALSIFILLTVFIFKQENFTKIFLPIARKLNWDEGLNKFSQTFDQYIKNKKILFLSLYLALIFQVVNNFVVYALALSLGIKVSFVAFFIVMPIVTLITALPISINGFGIQDISMVSLLLPLGYSSASILSLSILTHMERVFINLFGGFMLVSDLIFQRKNEN